MMLKAQTTKVNKENTEYMWQSLSFIYKNMILNKYVLRICLATLKGYILLTVGLVRGLFPHVQLSLYLLELFFFYFHLVHLFFW